MHSLLAMVALAVVVHITQTQAQRLEQHLLPDRETTAVAVTIQLQIPILPVAVVVELGQLESMEQVGQQVALVQIAHLLGHLQPILV
jgi:hypothetical protein